MDDAPHPAARSAARIVPIGAVAVAVGVVVLLGALVRARWQPLIEVDADGSEALVILGHGGEVDVLRVLTAAGSPAVRLVVLVPLAVLLAFRQRWRLVAFVALSGFLIGPVNTLAKSVVDRARPDHEGAVETAGGFSFPSGHSAGAAALATVVVVVFWPVLGRTWRRVLVAAALAGAVIVGYTRVALGVHFPSDVVAGWFVGVAWVLLLAVVLHVWPGEQAALRARVAARPRTERVEAAAGPSTCVAWVRSALVIALCAVGTVSCSSQEAPAVAEASGVVPEVVELPTLDVRAPVEPVDIGADRVLAPPEDPDVLGWWEAGRRPASQHGAALLAGHTISTGGGALERLEELRVGDPVVVLSADASVQFEVVDVETMTRAALTERAESLFAQDGDSRLLLITCEDWDGTDWVSNVVVQATPVAP